MLLSLGVAMSAIACGDTTNDNVGTPPGGAGSGGTAGSGGSQAEAGTTALAGRGGVSAAGAGSGGVSGTSNAGAAGQSGASTAGTAGEAGAAGSGGAASALSCKAIQDADAAASNGVFEIDPDGPGGEASVSVYCDMVTEGGGWTLGLIKNSVHDGSYASFGSGYVEVAALATTPEAASSEAAETPALAGWIDLNEFPYTDLRIAGYEKGAQVYTSKPIPKSSLRIKFGQNGYLLYNDVDGYYWCGGAAAYTDGGVGQVNKPDGAPNDCKTHTSLGDGWDFGGSSANTTLTVCGPGVSRLMKVSPESSFVFYPNPGAAQAIWIR